MCAAAHSLLPALPTLIITTASIWQRGTKVVRSIHSSVVCSPPPFTPTVSIVEVVALTEKDTTKDELNALLRDTSLEKMKGILGFTMDPVVSMDMKGDERSSIVDGQSTNVVGGNLVKVAAWYDNEWGYACRISDLCAFLVDKGL